MADSCQTRQTRLDSLQQLRGIAALLVTILHAINVVDFGVFRGTDSEPGFISTWVAFNEFGACGVDLFFVISGFVMAMLLQDEVRPSRTDFLYMRLARIMPFFWAAAFVYTLLSVIVGRTFPIEQVVANFTILPVSLHHFNLPVLVVGGSLAFELAFYFLVALILSSQKPVISITLLLLLLINLSMIRPAPPGLLSAFANPIQLEFLWGIAAHRLWRKLRALDISSIVAIGLLEHFHDDR